MCWKYCYKQTYIFLLEKGPPKPGFPRAPFFPASPTNADFNLLNVVFALWTALFDISSVDVSSRKASSFESSSV
jgi:hypothetical protein